MRKQTCPVCGSNELSSSNEEIMLRDPFIDEKKIDIKKVSCSSCGSSGDFFNENDELLKNAYKEMRHESVEYILDKFINNGISMSSIERILDLPQRTLTKWKNNTVSPSAAGLTLLRFVRLFPWLLEVAEKDYNFNEAQKIFISNGVNKFIRFYYANVNNPPSNIVEFSLTQNNVNYIFFLGERTMITPDSNISGGSQTIFCDNSNRDNEENETN